MNRLFSTATATLILEDIKPEITKDRTFVRSLKAESENKYKVEIFWRNVMLFILLHTGAMYGLYLIFTSAKLATTLFAYFVAHASALGIGAGAHRLWTHRAYKATWQLRLFLMIMNTIAFQDAIIHWARDHRMHHKYSETDADPHNARRGFFFAHVGWLCCRKHPAIKEKGRQIDVSDLYADPILVFQQKYYLIIMPLLCFFLPSAIPVYLWNETWSNAFFVAALLRYAFTLNGTWFVNSAAHFFGKKPYDKNIYAVENQCVSILTLGEGWHNYHHTFPWDYKAAEFKSFWTNYATFFIDCCAKIGWAYDLKSVSSDMINKRIERTGDGSYEVWGWGDEDQTEEERSEALITYQQKKD